MEHQQLRSILAMLKNTLIKRNADDAFCYSDTLNTMMQQHNMKKRVFSIK